MFTLSMPLSLLIPLAAWLALAPGAGAAPRSFYGMNWDREIAGAGDATLARELDAMRDAGVGTARTVFSWARAQPSEGEPFDFSVTDAVVAEAARSGVSLLPVILETPAWARKYPARAGSPPRAPRLAVRFLRAAVERYGSDGAFWLRNPTLPKRPVRHWQVWNEPELRAYWDEKRFWIGYSKLVRASFRALRRNDPRARLVLAGLTGFSWRSLRHLYESGLKGRFDVAAIHPYTGGTEDVAEIVRRNRRVMARFGEPRKPLWVTELSWPASKGRMKAPEGLRRVVTTDRGMARRLTSAYRYFASPGDRRHRVGRMYWYTWASRYSGTGDVFDYAGLGVFRGGELARKPAWHAYRAVAR